MSDHACPACGYVHPDMDSVDADLDPLVGLYGGVYKPWQDWGEDDHADYPRSPERLIRKALRRIVRCR